MKAFRLYWDKDKEEAWLNEMVEQGWAMKSFFFGQYTFERCKPGEYTYRIDLLDNLLSTKSSMEYIRFLEETGVEYVSGWARWAYFRKPVSEGAFELYTDLDSQINLYKKIRLMMGVVAVFELYVSISQMSTLSRLGLGLPIYILPGLLIGLGIIIGFAALKAHLRVTVLTKQKDLFY